MFSVSEDRNAFNSSYTKQLLLSHTLFLEWIFTHPLLKKEELSSMFRNTFYYFVIFHFYYGFLVIWNTYELFLAFSCLKTEKLML